MAKRSVDVCVVGSGPGGGVAGCVLATAGLKVALVEAGPRLGAGVDFGGHPSPREVYERRARGGPQRPILNLWQDFRERSHFTPIGERPDHGWLKAVGGRSLCWAGHSLRFGPLDYKRWPISYDEVAPYYSRAERFMGVYGYNDGLENIPDGEFLKPAPMRCPEEALRRGVERLKARGRKMEFIAQRKAMLTEPHRSGRALCHYCGHCGGCAVGAKYTSANTPIPLAERTGNLTLLDGAMMTRILLDASGRRVAGIEYTAAGGAVGRVEARAMVIACGAVETARHAGMNMQGTLLISPRKFVDLDPARKDRFGLNLSRVHLHYEQNDVAMAEDMVETCEEIIRAGGGRVISRPERITARELVIDSNHWVGTAGMGRDPKTSVIDTEGGCHEVPNLFLGDASVFPAYPEKNPTLTNIALSWRMSDRLVERFRKGELG